MARDADFIRLERHEETRRIQSQFICFHQSQISPRERKFGSCEGSDDFGENSEDDLGVCS